MSRRRPSTTRTDTLFPTTALFRSALPRGRARSLVVKAGNSNAFTGKRGRAAVEAITARVAKALGCQPADVFVASTGGIGVPLPIDKAEAGIDSVLCSERATWEEAAATIMTTDTFPKAAARSAVKIGRAHV